MRRRTKRLNELRQQWEMFPIPAQQCLVTLLYRYDADAAELALSAIKCMQGVPIQQERVSVPNLDEE